MNIALPICRACAPLDHRLGLGDGQAMLMAARSALRSPQSPPCAYTYPHLIGTIPSANCSANLIRTAPIPSATNRLNSNPHSLFRALASASISRGFLPRGLSDAYRQPQ